MSTAREAHHGLIRASRQKLANQTFALPPPTVSVMNGGGTLLVMPCPLDPASLVCQRRQTIWPLRHPAMPGQNLETSPAATVAMLCGHPIRHLREAETGVERIAACLSPAQLSGPAPTVRV